MVERAAPNRVIPVRVRVGPPITSGKYAFLQEREFEPFVLYYPAVEDWAQEGGEDDGTREMEQRERYLSDKCQHKGLAGKDWTDSEAGRGVVGDSTDNAEAEEVPHRRLAVLEEVVRGGAQGAVGERRDKRPYPPAARDRVEEDNAQEPEEEAAEGAVALAERHHGREHRLDVRQTERGETGEGHGAPAENELEPAGSEGECHTTREEVQY